MSNLNPEQREAVQTILGPVLINAGAGSGKTHTITERVVEMIRTHHIDPRSIFCVTFTNKAAKEMRERIAKKLGIESEKINPFRDSRLPMVGTFHSTAAFFLRMFIDRIGYAKDFVIYDSDDALRTVKEIMKSQNIDEKECHPRAIQGAISSAKGQGISPTEFSASVKSYFDSVVLDVYRAYSAKLKADNALDFDDLLLLFRQILDIEEVLEYFHTRFQYFMVDEYQDTNQLQYEIIKILASATRNLCVVGDDWQGIYSWRGADIENILSFQKDYKEAKVINLEENYRSTTTIINAANDVIKNNSRQMQKTLRTNNPEGEKITLLEGIDEKHEAELIASQIQNAKGNTHHTTSENTDGNVISPESRVVNYADFAILYRTNGQSRLIEEALIRKNIPYRVYGGMKFYERREIKDILSYIRLVFNPADSLSLKRIINVPSRKIGEKTLEELLRLLADEQLHISDLVDNLHFLDRLSTLGQKGVMSFLTLYGGLRHIASSVSVAELMQNIVNRSGYLEYLKVEYSEEEYESKVENIDEFMNMASRYDGLVYPDNLALFLEDIALITDQDRDNEPSNSGSVSLMTIHLAKGLEFPHVVIAGVEEGVFPHSRSLMESAAIEEERRLMYVALTRAKQKLYISRAHERYNFGNYSANPKSRFIKEISAEYIHIEENRGSAKSIFGGGGSGFSTFASALGVGGNGASSAKPISGKKNNASDFTLGGRVEHPQYGAGTIISLSGAIAEIAFPGMGVKKMNIEIAPVKRI